MSFPRFFVFQQVAFMPPVFPDVELPSIFCLPTGGFYAACFS
jgi:hypothetical protein